MPIYLVTFYSGIDGYTHHIDEDTRYFTNEAEANAYADKMNALYNVRDSFDYFVVEKIAKG